MEVHLRNKSIRLRARISFAHGAIYFRNSKIVDEVVRERLQFFPEDPVRSSYSTIMINRSDFLAEPKPWAPFDSLILAYRSQKAFRAAQSPLQWSLDSIMILAIMAYQHEARQLGSRRCTNKHAPSFGLTASPRRVPPCYPTANIPSETYLRFGLGAPSSATILAVANLLFSSLTPAFRRL